MPKRKLVMTAEDDGNVLHLTIEEWEVVGSSQVGPTPLLNTSVLSFAQLKVEDWRRDVAVMMVEAL